VGGRERGGGGERKCVHLLRAGPVVNKPEADASP
jgi:hypothetical protein